MKNYTKVVETERESSAPEPKRAFGRRAFLQGSLFAASLTLLERDRLQENERSADTVAAELHTPILPQPEPRGFAMPSLIGNGTRLFKGRLS